MFKYQIEINKNRSLFQSNNKILICNNQPIKKIYEHTFKSTIKYINIVNKTNILIIVGGGNLPYFPPNKLILWNYKKNEIKAEISHKYIINTVKIAEPYLVVLLSNYEAYIYNIFKLKKIYKLNCFNSIINLKLYNQNNLYFIYSNKIKGYITLWNNNKNTLLNFKAHENTINNIIFSNTHKFIATSSVIGTIIRIFNIIDGKMLIELRRGIEHSNILHISFNKNDTRLLCTTNKGSIHIFLLQSIVKLTQFTKIVQNTFIKNIYNYFNSTQSYWKAFIPNKLINAYFIKKNIILLYSENGYVYTIILGDKRECILINHIKITNI